MEALARQYCVYLVDLPGFGSMARVRQRFALLQAANWMVQWMDAIGLQRAHFIGHSMGGFVCLWIAAHRPEAVERLVLVAPAVIPHVHSIFGYIMPLLKSMRYMTPQFFMVVSTDTLRMGFITLLRAVHDLISIHLDDEIETVQVPTLLIWGEDDTLVPPSLGELLHQKMLHASLRIIPKAGHVCMFDQPAIFNATVKNFLAGH
ncbi:dihydrolipoamide acetyltransferase [Dictyobacter alpinus]|uniref:Dihydrolipoamide acetyltransferase n=1 Tax=Dictyobacter alpinus TaxID=2014873 RepID=A0A402BKG3_9CHLR|nr:dihydrolipoamide acetyltransferase [Dictyobacter alpinus]